MARAVALAPVDVGVDAARGRGTLPGHGNGCGVAVSAAAVHRGCLLPGVRRGVSHAAGRWRSHARRRRLPGGGGLAVDGRSEEHTSELQSPCNLVCRLLLEKKKNNKTQLHHVTLHTIAAVLP